MVDRTEFESVTPRVQGGYTTRLYYRPTRGVVPVLILIVVCDVSPGELRVCGQATVNGRTDSRRCQCGILHTVQQEIQDLTQPAKHTLAIW